MELMTLDIAFSFFTLALLEIVLGIDNLVFLAILSDKLPKEKRNFARRVGLFLALGMRLALLFAITWIIQLTWDVFTVFGQGISWRDIILIAGGLFLLVKATLEIHEQITHDKAHRHVNPSRKMMAVIVQIAVMDMVFSFDSIITAVGIADHVEVMVAAILVAMLVMVLAVNQVSDFITEHPTVKMLALSFLLLIGMVLVAEGFDVHVPKGYVYFAMLFSLMVEFLNMLVRRKIK